MAKTEASVVEERCVIQAEPGLVYTVLTTPADMVRWLCNEARCELRAGGPYELRWHSGYAAHGKVVSAEKPRLLSIAWRTAGEAGQTAVVFTVTPAEGGAEVTVRHSGFGRGAKGEAARREARHGWVRSLQNLKYVMETGIDLREAQRPLMGVTLGEQLDADRIAREGIATASGVYLTGVVPGLSAQAAGLQGGDVLTAVHGQAVTDFASLVNALHGYVVGDRVDVSYVRGPQHKTALLEMKPRPIAEIPSDPKLLLATLLERYAKARAALVKAAAGAKEEQAERPAAPGEWSAKQTIAHLCVTERDVQYALGDLILGNEPPYVGGNPSTLPEKLASVLAAAPTIAGLLNHLAQDQADTLAMVAALRPEIVANKTRYRRIGEVMWDMAKHVEEHVAQAKAALAAAG